MSEVYREFVYEVQTETEASLAPFAWFPCALYLGFMTYNVVQIVIARKPHTVCRFPAYFSQHTMRYKFKFNHKLKEASHRLHGSHVRPTPVCTSYNEVQSVILKEAIHRLHGSGCVSLNPSQ